MGEEAQPTVSDVERIAEKLGWNRDYDGEDARTAEDFILNSREIMNSKGKVIKNQNRELQDLRYAIDDLKNHHAALYEAEKAKHAREIKKLMAERKTAIDSGDSTRVGEIEQEIREIKAIPEPQKSDPKPPREFEDWHEKNEWYEKDTDLTAYANNLYELKKKDPKFISHTFKKQLELIEADVKNEFPDKFVKAKPPAGGVEGGGKKATGKKKFTINDLPPEYRKSAELFSKRNIMTVDQYIADLVETGVLS